MSRPNPKRHKGNLSPKRCEIEAHVDLIQQCCTAMNIMGQPLRDYSAGVRDALLWVLNGGEPPIDDDSPRCRECGCTDNDCSYCIKRTGQPCSWVEENLCSACASEQTS